MEIIDINNAIKVVEMQTGRKVINCSQEGRVITMTTEADVNPLEIKITFRD